MSTYPSFDYNRARAFPLATALLMARHRADVRSNGESPNSPLTQAIVNARARVRRYYEKNFRIVKTH